ncbi:K+dependent Na+ exchanger related-protein [Methanomethylovorans hollandica DSM 15978]|uniref:K+dependent Na+ exchanger related-protein n=2 Tax=Methanomethylovorans hollandica TaxID=101192 RepID=L0KVH3_METHD|nr:K+dependent Na+ exchanger related-protein [Methanomethylovorans hollandica DSM 15978]
MIAITVLLFILSLLMITKGADWFVESAVSISEKSGIPKVIVGATIVSFATTSPEFAVSATAALLGHTDMTVGNAVGSVTCNIGLILGSVLAVKAASVDVESFIRKGFFMALAGITLIVVSLDQHISKTDGIILLIIFVGFLYYNYKLQRAIFDGPEKVERTPLREMQKDIAYFLIGAILVVIGSRIMVNSGIELARIVGIPEMIISLTLVAFGTSLPEFITAISSTMKGHQDLSIGNIIGANTMDITLILGVCAQITSLEILDQSLSYDFPAMLAFVFLLLIFGVTKKRLERWEGASMVLLYGLYVAGLMRWYA